MSALLEERQGLGASRRASTPFETAIENARFQTHNLDSQIAQFETILIFFRHQMEIPHLLSKKESEIRIAQHRAILTSVLSLGEALIAQGKSVPVKCDLKRLTANVRYLREKYEDWYVDYDKEQAGEDFARIVNG